MEQTKTNAPLAKRKRREIEKKLIGISRKSNDLMRESAI
jgi:hypothetical protein